MGTKPTTSLYGSTNTPGPGNYNTVSGGRPGSGVTMGAKYHSRTLNEEPGPGAYNMPEGKKNGPKIGTSKRSGLGGKANFPGPG